MVDIIELWDPMQLIYSFLFIMRRRAKEAHGAVKNNRVICAGSSEQDYQK